MAWCGIIADLASVMSLRVAWRPRPGRPGFRTGRQRATADLQRRIVASLAQ